MGLSFLAPYCCCLITCPIARLRTWLSITLSCQYLIASFSFTSPHHRPLALFVHSSSSYSFSPPYPCPFVLISSYLSMSSSSSSSSVFSSSSPRLFFSLSPCLLVPSSPRLLVSLSQTPPPSSSLFPQYFTKDATIIR